MIKFFRHIRRSLINQNQMGKYFKYAIGEILLVVIGILIALQINNWNSNKKDREKERVVLVQINHDFKSNKKQLDSIIIINQRKMALLNTLINTLSEYPDHRTMDTLITYADDILVIKTFNPSNGAVEALINSSSFELIQNDSLRKLLGSWKDIYMDYQEEEVLETNFQLHYLTPYLRKEMNLLKPYAKQNLETITTIEFQNIWLDKRTIASFALDAIKEEKIALYIDEIIRLSDTND